MWQENNLPHGLLLYYSRRKIRAPADLSQSSKTCALNDSCCETSCMKLLGVTGPVRETAVSHKCLFCFHNNRVWRHAMMTLHVLMDAARATLVSMEEPVKKYVSPRVFDTAVIVPFHLLAGTAIGGPWPAARPTKQQARSPLVYTTLLMTAIEPCKCSVTFTLSLVMPGTWSSPSAGPTSVFLG